jgi:hypothetical protein
MARYVDGLSKTQDEVELLRCSQQDQVLNSRSLFCFASKGCAFTTTIVSFDASLDRSQTLAHSSAFALASCCACYTTDIIPVKYVQIKVVMEIVVLFNMGYAHVPVVRMASRCSRC